MVGTAKVFYPFEEMSDVISNLVNIEDFALIVFNRFAFQQQFLFLGLICGIVNYAINEFVCKGVETFINFFQIEM